MDDEETEENATSEKYLRAHVIGELKPLSGPIVLADYDPQWPQLFQHEAEKIRRALGDRALLVEHVGSTSVPDLPAKPIIDIALVVADSANEAAYAGSLESAGYRLRIREPNWYQHRVFKGLQNRVNLHVFCEGCPEIRRMLAFRDWLRMNEATANCMHEPNGLWRKGTGSIPRTTRTPKPP